MTARELAVCRGAAWVGGLRAAKREDWWARASAEEGRKEIDRVSSKAEAVLAYWRQMEGIAG